MIVRNNSFAHLTRLYQNFTDFKQISSLKTVCYLSTQAGFEVGDNDCLQIKCLELQFLSRGFPTRSEQPLSTVLYVFCVMYQGLSLVLQLLETEFYSVFLFKFWISCLLVKPARVGTPFSCMGRNPPLTYDARVFSLWWWLRSSSAESSCVCSSGLPQSQAQREGLHVSMPKLGWLPILQ